MSPKRDRAWRRAQKSRVGGDPHGQRTRGFRYGDPYPKRWNEICFRHNKLHRARQLGLIWPAKEWLKFMADTGTLHVLFVCSKNQWRSPTGERIWKGVAGVETRSAGTSRSAKRQISLADLRWADLILVMEEKHKSRIRADFRDETRYKPIHVLDIPDDYLFMDDELVELIRAKSEPFTTSEMN